MATIPFEFLEDPQTRKPSKVKLVFLILFILLLILSIVFIALYVVKKTKTTESEYSNKSSTSNICISPACIASAAEILNKLDTSAKPCDDFYQYSCGGFEKKTHLSDELSLDSFDLGNERIQLSLRDLLQNEQLITKYSKNKKSAVDKAFTFFKSCMDEGAIKTAGVKPILDVIEQYGSCNITNKNWTADSWILEKILARIANDLQVPVLLGTGVFQSFFNSSEIYIVLIGGKTHSDFLQDQFGSAKVKEVASSKSSGNVGVDFMSDFFKLLGFTQNINADARRILDLENEFKGIKKDRTLDFTKINEVRKEIKFLTLDELNKLTSYKFNWTVYFNEVFQGTDKSIRSGEKLMVFLPDNIKEIVEWMVEKPKSVLANEIIWSILLKFLKLLPSSFRDLYHEMTEKKYGVQIQPTPRWKTCTIMTDTNFMYATSLLYVNEYVSDDALKTVSDLYTEIRGQFREALNEQTWMDNATRARARLKVDRMADYIGYPKFIKESDKLNKYYETVQVSVSHLMKNQLNYLKYQNLKELDKSRNPLDKSEFPLLNSRILQTNAQYVNIGNSMVILAGILQTPFYEDHRLKAVDYGSIGMVVGHEILHAFDKSGSYFDETGSLHDWWSDESRKNFDKRADCIVKQYSRHKTLYGVQVNGNLTLSENIADDGGLKYAFRAYKKWKETHDKEEKLPGIPLSNDQLFFVGFAQLWCTKYSGKSIVEYVIKTDEHSPGPVRVRVPLSDFREFAKAFGCPMAPPEKTCVFW